MLSTPSVAQACRGVIFIQMIKVVDRSTSAPCEGCPPRKPAIQVGRPCHPQQICKTNPFLALSSWTEALGVCISLRKLNSVAGRRVSERAGHRFSALPAAVAHSPGSVTKSPVSRPVGLLRSKQFCKSNPFAESVPWTEALSECLSHGNLERRKPSRDRRNRPGHRLARYLMHHLDLLVILGFTPRSPALVGLRSDRSHYVGVGRERVADWTGG